MSFKVKNFSTIRIHVEDVTKSRQWYQSFFGLAPVEDLENFASFKIGQTYLDIALSDAKSPLSRGGSVGYWLVDNLEEAINHATKLGGKVYRGPLKVNEIQRTIVQILDPHGNVFGLEAEN